MDHTIVSPVSCPGVSYDPVSVRSGDTTVTYELNAMVKVVVSSTASGSLHDTSGIILPWFGINANGWSTDVGNGSSKSILVLAVALSCGTGRSGILP